MPTILITRPAHQAEPLKSMLEARGAVVLLQPTIDILEPDSWEPVDRALRRLNAGGFDWLVFSSANGVEFFFNRLEFFHRKNYNLPRLAAVGPGTDDKLRERIGRPADLVPDRYTAEGLVEKLLPEAEAGKRFLLPRASRGRDVMRPAFSAAGGAVTEIVVYRSVDRERPSPEILEKMLHGDIDWVTVTSSAVACSLVRLFGDALHRTRLLSISPITSETLETAGHPPAREAAEASTEGLVAGLLF